ncbi:hypothetical protein [Planctomicrobium piriforme]|uniref:hypothetical protein n=1 Tax=Planctomicrobium piriforme TaxID=1576369 RepID=UPI00111334BD|nr:hypothetical protein [Planctomicrobium piriforme]
MAHRPHIPRPRHLFPETAAFFILARRMALYCGFGARTAIGQVPIWIAGSLAGVMALMLTISLFFIREPVLQAAPVVFTEPAPALQMPEPQPTLAEPVPTPIPNYNRPHLFADFERTSLPFPFDEERMVTNTSTVPQPALTPSTQRDLWRLAGRRGALPEAFASYLQSATTLPFHWGTLSASDTVPLQFAPDAARGMGLLIEKPPIAPGVPGQPLTYEIIVINVSLATIEQLEIREKISEVQRVTNVLPAASVVDNELAWNLTSFEPGAVKTFQVTLIPEVQGEIFTETRIMPKSRVSASVNVHPALDTMQPAAPPQPTPVIANPIVSTVPGAPELKLSYTSVSALKRGDVLSMTFSVTNIGTAAADDVLLYVRLSGEFEHRYGEFVQHRIGHLEPGQTRRALLQATARTPGDARLATSLKMGDLEAEARELKIPISTTEIGTTAQPLSAEAAPTQKSDQSTRRPPGTAGMWVAREP